MYELGSYFEACNHWQLKRFCLNLALRRTCFYKFGTSEIANSIYLQEEFDPVRKSLGEKCLGFLGACFLEIIMVKLALQIF